MIVAKFSGNKISSATSESFALCEKSRFGEKVEGKVEYMPVEALSLLSQRKMQIFSSSKPLSEESLLKKLRKGDKMIDLKLIVFNDLRKRGYIIKTALKFGADFRVYGKGAKPGEEHARWLLSILKENDNISIRNLAAKSRIAHSTRKSMLFAVVDDEGSVSYYDINWTRL